MSHTPTVHSPTSLSAAYALLAERAGQVKIIAGGTDLMVLLNSYQLEAAEFMDIWRLDELRGIVDEGAALRVGALTTFTQLIQSPVIQQHLPLLVDAARTIGAIQIQNRATIGGNIVNASPAGDSLPVLAALDAEVEIGSARGLRRESFNRFYTGYRRTVLAPDELVVAVRLSKLSVTERALFYKVGARRAQAISKLVMAVRARIEAGEIASIGIGVGSVAPTVIRAMRTEALLTSARLSFDLIEQARQMVAQEIAPITDVRSTEHYRRTVSGNVLAKILRRWL